MDFDLSFYKGKKVFVTGGECWCDCDGLLPESSD